MENNQSILKSQSITLSFLLVSCRCRDVISADSSILPETSSITPSSHLSSSVAHLLTNPSNLPSSPSPAPPTYRPSTASASAWTRGASPMPPVSISTSIWMRHLSTMLPTPSSDCFFRMPQMKAVSLRGYSRLQNSPYRFSM